ncbi:MAG TPA: lysozyme inhibitor LprI family protein, partial [Parvibaculum sp.]
MRLMWKKLDLKFLVWSGLAASALSLFAPSSAVAASFDCVKAKTGIERAICADADVSRQDGLLQETYQKLLKESANPDKLKTEQRDWIKERDRCGGKEPDKTICLSLAYYARRGRLETDLFLNGRGVDKSTTKDENLPDMWLMRTINSVFTYHGRIAIFFLRKDIQKQLGMEGKIDDYFYVDLLPSEGGKKSPYLHKHLLRGFFSGQSTLVLTLPHQDGAYKKDGIVLDSANALPPLPINRDIYGTTILLTDNSFL